MIIGADGVVLHAAAPPLPTKHTWQLSASRQQPTMPMSLVSCCVSRSGGLIFYNDFVTFLSDDNGVFLHFAAPPLPTKPTWKVLASHQEPTMPMSLVYCCVLRSRQLIFYDDFVIFFIR